jgi:protein ImuB
MKRFMSISFPYLVTDWWTIRQPLLKKLPVVISAKSHGRMIISSVNELAERENIHPGMVLADARAIIPALHVIDEEPLLAPRLLKKIAEWCIRYTPVTAVDDPDSILLDTTGCAHLWGDEQIYLDSILCRLKQFGYSVRAAISDTIGASWAIARFGKQPVVENKMHIDALMKLPPEALRLDAGSLEKLYKLGLTRIGDFIHLPRRVLYRRFGKEFMQRIDQAIGNEEEIIKPVKLETIYSERLPCLEFIVTAAGIEIALERLIEKICYRLKSEEKGLRKTILKCYRCDNRIEKIEIGTSSPTSSAQHIKKLFEEKICRLEPGPGIELFILEAPVIEPHQSQQNNFWQTSGGLKDRRIAELVDKLSMRVGQSFIHRYAPAEHYWPERSFIEAPLNEKFPLEWKADKRRPVYMFPEPQKIQVTAPIPDYPPMLFRYGGTLHKISKADGPERIEQEWWIQEGEHRDYYIVENEQGSRYWIFRSGHYEAEKTAEWYLHGLFA